MSGFWERYICFNNQYEEVFFYHYNCYSQTMCYLVTFMELYVSHASVLTILAITVERYYAICLPLQAGSVWTKRKGINWKKNNFMISFWIKVKFNFKKGKRTKLISLMWNLEFIFEVENFLEFNIYLPQERDFLWSEKVFLFSPWKNEILQIQSAFHIAINNSQGSINFFSTCNSHTKQK